MGIITTELRRDMTFANLEGEMVLGLIKCMEKREIPEDILILGEAVNRLDEGVYFGTDEYSEGGYLETEEGLEQMLVGLLNDEQEVWGDCLEIAHDYFNRMVWSNKMLVSRFEKLLNYAPVSFNLGNYYKDLLFTKGLLKYVLPKSKQESYAFGFED